MLKLSIVAFAFKIAVFFLLISTSSIHAENAALYQKLQNSWTNIFPTGNRNAGGPLFFNHIFHYSLFKNLLYYFSNENDFIDHKKIMAKYFKV